MAVCPMTPVPVVVPDATMWSGGPMTSRTKLIRYVARSSIGPPANSGRCMRWLAGERFAEVGDHRSDVAYSVGLEKLTQDVEFRQERGPVRLHAEQAAASGNIGDPLALNRIECQWLLDHVCVFRPPAPTTRGADVRCGGSRCTRRPRQGRTRAPRSCRANFRCRIAERTRLRCRCCVNRRRRCADSNAFAGR